MALPPPAGAGAAALAARSQGPPPLAPSEPLWVRRQLFEHAVTVPLLSGVAPSVDWGGLAAALRAAAVGELREGGAGGGGGLGGSDSGGGVTEEAWVHAAASWMQLDAAAAGVVVEELAANVPEAFARVNPGAGTPVAPFPVPGTAVGVPAAAPPSPPTLPRRIPVPELLAFLRLHAAAKGMAATYRATANAVWPEAMVPVTPPLPAAATAAAAAAVTPGGAPNGDAPPGGGAGAPGTSPSGSADAGRAAATLAPSPLDGGVEPLVAAATAGVPAGGGGGASPGMSSGELTPTHRPKGSPTGQFHRHMAHSAIVASDANARERETQLVAACLGDLLLVVAASYGVVIDAGGGGGGGGRVRDGALRLGRRWHHGLGVGGMRVAPQVAAPVAEEMAAAVAAAVAAAAPASPVAGWLHFLQPPPRRFYARLQQPA